MFVKITAQSRVSDFVQLQIELKKNVGNRKLTSDKTETLAHLYKPVVYLLQITLTLHIQHA